MSHDLSDDQLARLEAWSHDALPAFRGPLTLRKFPTGQSNPTYELGAGQERYVLRRQPDGKLLPSAHAVDREYRVMRALAGTCVPVPRMLALCEDPAVLGMKFFVMARVDGRTLVDPALPDFGERQRRALYESQVDLLAQLARVNVTALALDDFGAPGDYVARQIARWSRQYRSSETRTIEAMESLMDWLPANAPPDDGSRALVHGDFRLDNMLLHPQRSEILALIDWELSTIGHPLIDVTYLMTMLRLPPHPTHGGLGGTNRAVLGIPSELELLQRFIAQSGVTAPARWEFYIAFHFFRFAAILQGIAKRVETGNASNRAAAAVAAMAQPMAEMGWSIATS